MLDAPPLSVAFAVRTYVPGTGLLQVRKKARLPGPVPSGNGGSRMAPFETTPRLSPPAKNSTLVTYPSGSEPNAARLTFPGEPNVWPLVGEKIFTYGGRFVTPSGVI